jgi:hypothetical protein
MPLSFSLMENHMIPNKLAANRTLAFKTTFVLFKTGFAYSSDPVQTHEGKRADDAIRL